MPQEHPEDRVKVRNIASTDREERVPFPITKYRKEEIVDANGRPTIREVPYEEEVEWDFRNGFLFIYGQKPYVLSRTEPREYPRYLAMHCAKNQADHVMARMWKDSEFRMQDGRIGHDQNILSNKRLKDKLIKDCIVETVEYYEQDNRDFETILNQRYGGDFESASHPDDVEVKVDEYDEKPLELKKGKGKKSSDPEIERLRSECDDNGVEWLEADTSDQLREKILKMMA